MNSDINTEPNERQSINKRPTFGKNRHIWCTPSSLHVCGKVRTAWDACLRVPNKSRALTNTWTWIYSETTFLSRLTAHRNCKHLVYVDVASNHTSHRLSNWLKYETRGPTVCPGGKFIKSTESRLYLQIGIKDAGFSTTKIEIVFKSNWHKLG